MPKVLKMIFTGVCTFAPTTPADPNTTLDDFFVLMPAARAPRLSKSKDEHNNPRVIARHQAYLYIPDKILGTVPEPALLVRDEVLGLCNVYLMDNARISLSRKPDNPLKYFVDPQNRPVKDRPSTDDPQVAPRNDSRWVADSAEVFPNGARLRPDLDPKHDITSKDVTMVVHLDGGLIEAGNACATTQPRSFQPAQVAIQERVFSPELTVTMNFPDDTESIRLKVGFLNPADRVAGLDVDGVELFWRNEPMIQVRVGNDTLDEIVALRNDGRCAAPPELPEFEAEFELHYDLLQLAPNPQNPLPKRGGHEGDTGGCIGIKVKYP